MNQFDLAQYINTTPVEGTKHNTYDASPVLQHLPDHLMKFLERFIKSGGLAELINNKQHSNLFMFLLAKEADQFYASRTMTDLLMKQQIIEAIMMAFYQAVTTLTSQMKGPVSIISLLTVLQTVDRIRKQQM